MASKRHRHTFTGLWSHLGPYCPWDVHVHSCFDYDCDRVLIGKGRDCDGKPESHYRETLTGDLRVKLASRMDVEVA